MLTPSYTTKFKKDIKVITNAVNIASELAASENEVILTGGFLRENSFSLVGPITEAALMKMTADKFFLGVDGIHFEYGLTTPNMMEGRVNQLMLKIAHEVILVADSSKFGKRSMSVIAQIQDVHKIITDKNILKEDDYEILEADNGLKGLQMATTKSPDCILLDLIMPEIDGVKIIKSLSEQDLQIPIIVITAEGRTLSLLYSFLAIYNGTVKNISDATKQMLCNQVHLMQKQFP